MWLGFAKTYFSGSMQQRRVRLSEVKVSETLIVKTLVTHLKTGFCCLTPDPRPEHPTSQHPTCHTARFGALKPIHNQPCLPLHDHSCNSFLSPLDSCTII